MISVFAHHRPLFVTLSRCRKGLSSFAVTIVLTVSPATAASNDQISAPAKNWVLPMFSKEGYRSMTARGTEARLVDSKRFDIVDLNLTVFSGDAATRVETILLSPAATFLPEAKVARGDKSVRFIGDEIEASGMKWVYRHADKKISLDGSVHVSFSAELKNLLQ
ncbi:MAG: hypothetical protein ABIV50_01015 [Opitutus sp.]